MKSLLESSFNFWKSTVFISCIIYHMIWESISVYFMEKLEENKIEILNIFFIIRGHFYIYYYIKYLYGWRARKKDYRDDRYVSRRS